MNFHVLSKRTRVRVTFVATNVLTTIRFFQRVNVNVLPAIAGVRESFIAAFKFARERPLARVRANVDFQVLRTGEALPASRLIAREGLLAGVNSDVIDQFVLCLEGQSISHALFPTTDEPHGRGGDQVYISDVRYKVLYSIKTYSTDLVNHLL